MKIPPRFKDASVQDIPPVILDKFNMMKETRRGIYIHGEVGTGKTHIAYALAKQKREIIKAPNGEILEEYYSIDFVNATELFAEMRKDMDRPYTEKLEPLTKLMASRKIIIIDDIGSEKMSEWVSEQFYLLLNYRYNEMIPVIFTSNLSLAQLAERVGDRTVSRIAGMCDVIKLNGEDRRLK